MTLVKPKAETREAWQYTGQPRSEWPRWLHFYLYHNGQCLFLERRSGVQAVELTEWLIRNLDGEPEWLTHEQMRKSFDEIVRAARGNSA